MKKLTLSLLSGLMISQFSTSAQAACPPLSPKGITKCIGIEGFVPNAFNTNVGECTLQLIHVPANGSATNFLGTFMAGTYKQCAAICKDINAEGMVDSPISCPPNGD